jgi:hypothetical protein
MWTEAGKSLKTGDFLNDAEPDVPRGPPMAAKMGDEVQL